MQYEKRCPAPKRTRGRKQPNYINFLGFGLITKKEAVELSASAAVFVLVCCTIWGVVAW